MQMDLTCYIGKMEYKMPEGKKYNCSVVCKSQDCKYVTYKVAYASYNTFTIEVPRHLRHAVKTANRLTVVKEKHTGEFKLADAWYEEPDEGLPLEVQLQMFDDLYGGY